MQITALKSDLDKHKQSSDTYQVRIKSLENELQSAKEANLMQKQVHEQELR